MYGPLMSEERPIRRRVGRGKGSPPPRLSTSEASRGTTNVRSSTIAAKAMQRTVSGYARAEPRRRRSSACFRRWDTCLAKADAKSPAPSPALAAATAALPKKPPCSSSASERGLPSRRASSSFSAACLPRRPCWAAARCKARPSGTRPESSGARSPKRRRAALCGCTVTAGFAYRGFTEDHYPPRKGIAQARHCCLRREGRNASWQRG